MSDEQEAAMYRALDRAKAAEAKYAALRDAVTALADDLELNGIACDCGHSLGEHNGLGCYGAITYSPLVRCGCPLTDDRHDGELVVLALRALLGTPQAEQKPEPQTNFKVDPSLKFKAMWCSECESDSHNTQDPHCPGCLRYGGTHKLQCGLRPDGGQIRLSVTLPQPKDGAR